MSKKHAGYVFIPIKKGQRDGLNALKKYGDTYDTIIQMLLNDHYNRKIDDLAAQNVDDSRDENG